MSDLRVVGHSVPRVDGLAKVTGSATYAVDVDLPGMAHGVAVRSDRAHAHLVGVDATEAEAVPGVVRVIAAADLRGLNPRFGHTVRDHPAIAVDRVRYYGEPVALVVADTRAAAEQAARLVRVSYDELPALMDVESALAPGAPLLHADRDFCDGDPEFLLARDGLEPNVCAEESLGWGDVDAELRACDLVLEGEYRYPMLYGYAMEPYNATAAFEHGRLTVYSSAQHPYMVRADLAQILELPLSHVRVIVPYVGGGYGSKSYTKIEPLAAIGSFLTGRKVQVALSVEESMLTTRSLGAHIRVRSGFSSEGRLRARDYELLLDGGAYTDNCPAVMKKAVTRCFGPYRIPALRVRARAVFTNTVAGSSLRGFGAPQTNLAGESQIDEAAMRLGVDPVELRLRNLAGPGDEILPGRRPLDADLPADLRMLAEALGWPEAASERAIGFGLSASDAGGYPSSVSLVRMQPDGSASASVGATELGQGSWTVLSQIIAEELELPFERVTVVGTDTAVTTYERTTGASRTTAIAGRSLQAACRDLRARVRSAAAEVLGVEKEAVADAPGGVRAGDRLLDYGAVVRGWFGAGGEIVGVGSVRRSGEFEMLPPFWEVGVTGVAISVDEETGRVTVDQLAAVGDVGFALHPAMLHGQDAGATTMGLGAALSEQLVYEGETLSNPNVVDYRVPRFGDLPARVDLLTAQRREGIGPYGAKGAGEGALNPVGGAVASAVARALGVFPRELPLTPERVWRLVAQRDAAPVGSQSTPGR